MEEPSDAGLTNAGYLIFFSMRAMISPRCVFSWSRVNHSKSSTG